MIDINTHNRIDPGLCGKVVKTEMNEAEVQLKLTDNMKVDDTGLIHGGFIFGIADHAAMVAVNHPNVALGSAEIKFLKPTVVGDLIIAKAKMKETNGKKNIVEVDVYHKEELIFKGTFICFVPEFHVLDKKVKK
jgi:acyl-coenzyme A thioesterase PaaI-like protein